MISKIKGKIIWIADRIEYVITGYLFDLFWGVETRKPLDRFDLDVDESKRVHSWSYEACSYPRFRRVMKMLLIEPEQFTFIDIGSGKGRQLIAAALYGFPKVIGVEYSPCLHKAAQRNVATFIQRQGSKSSISLENVDATQYNIPSEACLLFMANPFKEPIVRKFLTSLKTQIGGRKQSLYVAYVHPTVRIAFDESNMFKLIATLPWPTDAVIYQLNLPNDSQCMALDKAMQVHHD